MSRSFEWNCQVEEFARLKQWSILAFYYAVDSLESKAKDGAFKIPETVKRLQSLIDGLDGSSMAKGKQKETSTFRPLIFAVSGVI